jgi:hypothetical protein
MSDNSPVHFDPFALWRDWFVRSEQQWSENLSTMLKDERIAATLGKEAQRALLGQKMFAEVMERYLAVMHLPSRTDVEKLGDRLGQVEDVLAALQAEIVLLRSAMIKAGTVSSQVAAMPLRTRKPPKQE